MSKRTDNGASPIRRISKDEKDLRRQWPDKKHLSSTHNIPLPKPGQKNRIHSVLVALPVLMLMIGLYVYYKGESTQHNGSPILSDLVERAGQFKSVSEVSGIGKARFYLWHNVAGKTKGVRISSEQKLELGRLEYGDDLIVEVTPTVAGSKTLWLYRATHDGREIISPSSVQTK